jgi:hypothetical protein
MIKESFPFSDKCMSVTADVHPIRIYRIQKDYEGLKYAPIII